MAKMMTPKKKKKKKMRMTKKTTNVPVNVVIQNVPVV